MTGYTFNQLFDFTRTTAGTFVGSNGLIQTTPASVNLLTFTQEFDNAAWTKNNATVTANSATAPDGTNTADTITLTGASIGVRQLVSASTLPRCYSFYVKNNSGARYFQILTDGVVNAFANFDTQAEVIGTRGSSVSASSITSAGNGWYRIQMTATDASAINIYCSVVPSNTAGWSLGASSGSFFIWGAQLELGSTATTYARNNGGLFPPRFDYDPVTLAPRGILIEEQRTNLVLYSDQLNDGVWTKSQTTVTANSVVSPDGSTNADTLSATASGVAWRQTYQIGKTLTAIPYAWSVYAKSKELNWLVINAFDGSNRATYFNLANGTVGTVAAGDTAYIQNVGNGWYRCIVTRTAAATANGGLSIELTTGDNIAPTTANLTAGQGIFVYGAQLEAGAFATSYIPTVASQVTRTADVCTISAPMFAPWYNQNEGTVVWEGSFFATSIVSGLFSNNDGSSSNRVDFRTNSSGFVSVGGVTQASFSVSPLPINTTNKVAVAVRLNDFAAVANGGALSTDASGTVPTVSRMLIGALDAGANQLNGHIRRVQFYPFRASNNQLQALST